ncbi:MAG: GHKL domain-containing protein [Cytophagaceae bacterium]|nr:GHKL domain-containing protein [Cytophagaceae bacterium]
MIASYRFSLILVFIAFSQLGKGQTIIQKELKENFTITNSVYFIEDPGKSLTAEQIIASSDFKKVPSEIPNFGTSTSTFWLKIDLKNLTEQENYLLEVAQPGLDEVHLYYFDKNHQLKHSTTGEYLPFDHREIADPNYIFNILLPKNQVSSVYISVSSRDFLQIPLLLGTRDTFFDSIKTKDTMFGLYAGFMLVMLLYNSFLYFNIKDRNYLFYIIYLSAVIITQTSILGYAFQYIWPNFPLLAQYSWAIHGPLVGITSLLFTREFLRTHHYYPKLDKGLNFFIVGYLLAVVLAFLQFFKISFTIINSFAGILSLYMLVLAFLIGRKKYKPAKFFLIAWSAFLIGVTLFTLGTAGILPFNNLTLYMMPMGSAVEVVLLSFALADNINTLKKEKEASQAEVFLALQENGKLIREQNVILEQKVSERTTELANTNGELSVTLHNLKATQAQLVDAEKMASLGQLTAGIAHEINNPINFVSANIKPLQMDIEDIIEVINKYEKITGVEELEVKLKEIEAYKKQIDLDYTKAEIKTLLAGIEDGARRTAEIVTGLKTFSRLDESDVKTANINDGIESTLTMIRSAIPENIKVVKHLGTLPIIECFPGKLNQVFMNTFNNAIQAIAEKKTGGTLIISSYVQDDQHICISVEDNGIGMTPETKTKIFEPFFTTKDVGQGTGLGMSIVFKIIESHQGNIAIDTEFGRGTKIILTLPMKLTVS